MSVGISFWMFSGASDVLCPCTCWRDHWFLTWGSGVLLRPPSQMWGKLYIPMFLIRVWLFTHMNVGLLNCSIETLPLPVYLKLSSVVEWPVMEWWPFTGDHALKCSLNLSPKVLATSPMYLSLHFELLAPIQINNSIFLFHGILILGDTSMFFSLLLPLKEVQMQIYLDYKYRMQNPLQNSWMWVHALPHACLHTHKHTYTHIHTYLETHACLI